MIMDWVGSLQDHKLSQVRNRGGVGGEAARWAVLLVRQIGLCAVCHVREAMVVGDGVLP